MMQDCHQHLSVSSLTLLPGLTDDKATRLLPDCPAEKSLPHRNARTLADKYAYSSQWSRPGQ